MTPYGLLAALLVVTAAASAVALWHGWADRRDPTAPPRRRRHRTSLTRRTKTLLLLGTALGALIALLTGWLVALIITPAAVAGLPFILGKPVAESEIRNLIALDDWVRSLSSVLRAGAGLEQAIVSTHRSVPAPIEADVARLIQRLRANIPTGDALRAFAEDLDDATGDLVCGALIQAAQIRGDGLAAVLRQLAASVSEDVRNRRGVEAARRQVRTTTKWITAITVGFVAAVAVLTNFLAFYATPTGQIVFLAFTAAYAVCLIWMRRLAQPPRQPRFLAGRTRHAPDATRGRHAADTRTAAALQDGATP